MKEQNYDFRKRLLVVHEPNLRDSGRKPQADEFELRDGMTICAIGDEVIQTAAADLADFLRISMGVSARVTQEKTAAQVTVSLASDFAFELGEAAAYRGFMVVTDEQGIHVYGHDSRGAAQGVYYLEDVMTFAKAPVVSCGSVWKKPLFSPQMIHSAYGLDEFPDEYLARVAHEGRDAILVFTEDVNKTPSGYLDFNELIRRAAQYGLDVYAYSYLISDVSPESPEADAYYENNYGRLFRECPGLAGVTLVGESVEFPSRDPHVAKGHYYETAVDGIPSGKVSSGWYPCEDYPIWLNMVKSKVRKYNPNADVVFWTYNWGYHPEEARVKLIESLPTDISLQATFEMFEPRKIGSSTVHCADYTLSFEGPGRYFESEAVAAKKRGIRLYSMTNTGGLTWDFGTIPYEPMPQQWMRRYKGMQKAHDEWGLCGIMETHHYGFYPSFISKLSKWCFWEPREDMEAVLARILGSEFGAENLTTVTSALNDWSDAIRHYTPTNADQYGAFRVGPSYPMAIDSVPNSPSDDKAMFGSRICHPNYTSTADARDSLLSVRIGDEIASIQTMLCLLNEGLSKLEAIANPNEKLKNLIRLGTFMRNSTQTGLHAKQLYVLKTKLFAETDKTKLAELLDSIEKLLRDEMQNAADTIPLVEADSRLGWEPSMHYMTDAWHLDWKMRQITSVLKFSLPEYRKSLAK